MESVKRIISKFCSAIDISIVVLHQRVFGGYVFEVGEPGEDLMVIFSSSKDVLRNSVNDDADDVFRIDYSGSNAVIKINEDWIELDGDQLYFGISDKGFTRISVWSADKDGLDKLINKYFRINPIGERVMIEPPVGLDDSENVVYID